MTDDDDILEIVEVAAPTAPTPAPGYFSVGPMSIVVACGVVGCCGGGGGAAAELAGVERAIRAQTLVPIRIGYMVHLTGWSLDRDATVRLLSEMVDASIVAVLRRRLLCRVVGRTFAAVGAGMEVLALDLHARPFGWASQLVLTLRRSLLNRLRELIGSAADVRVAGGAVGGGVAAGGGDGGEMAVISLTGPASAPPAAAAGRAAGAVDLTDDAENGSVIIDEPVTPAAMLTMSPAAKSRPRRRQTARVTAATATTAASDGLIEAKAATAEEDPMVDVTIVTRHSVQEHLDQNVLNKLVAFLRDDAADVAQPVKEYRIVSKLHTAFPPGVAQQWLMPCVSRTLKKLNVQAQASTGIEQVGLSCHITVVFHVQLGALRAALRLQRQASEAMQELADVLPQQYATLSCAADRGGLKLRQLFQQWPVPKGGPQPVLQPLPTRLFVRSEDGLQTPESYVPRPLIRTVQLPAASTLNGIPTLTRRVRAIVSENATQVGGSPCPSINDDTRWMLMCGIDVPGSVPDTVCTLCSQPPLFKSAFTLSCGHTSCMMCLAQRMVRCRMGRERFQCPGNGCKHLVSVDDVLLLCSLTQTPFEPILHDLYIRYVQTHPHDVQPCGGDNCIQVRRTTDTDFQCDVCGPALVDGKPVCLFCESELEAGHLGEGWSACSNADCMVANRLTCAKRLACGHRCTGLSTDTTCKPCLKCVGWGDVNSEADCPICCDSLGPGPNIQLTCSHIFHYQCIQRGLNLKWSSKAISFNFMDCPLCRVPMDHPAIRARIAPLQALREKVRKLKLERLAEEKELPEDARANPEAYADTMYEYYQCDKCQEPYFGGMRECGGPPAEAGGEKEQKLCFRCSPASRSASCPKHGQEDIAFKCRFCCSIAMFHCWGTTHFCNACHLVPQSPPVCAAPHHVSGKPVDSCPLHMEHPPSGAEFVIGCFKCLNLASTIAWQKL